METSWWNPALNIFATQLSKGMLNEMKKRIETSNIKKEKLMPNEDSPRMRAFFEREIGRFERRKASVQSQQDQAVALASKVDTVEDENRELRIQLEKANTTIEKYKNFAALQMTYVRSMESRLAEKMAKK